MIGDIPEEGAHLRGFLEATGTETGARRRGLSAAWETLPVTRLERLLLKEEIEEFLLAEADLLDDGRWDDWLALLAPDIRYVMPMRLNIAFASPAGAERTAPDSEVCWFDDDLATLTKRVRQLQTGVHWAEEPRSRVTHLFANLRVLDVDGDEVTAGCRFVVYRNRVATETDLFVGRRTDVLRRNGSSWLLASRTLLLDQNVLLAKNLTLLF